MSFNDQIIEEFRANGGRAGQFGNGLVLLHTIGAKSRDERVSPVASFPDGDGWIIVASAGGQPKHPAWFHNLVANPDVTIEVGTETLEVHAETVGDDEHPALWQTVTAQMPGFADYQAKVERRIPLVRLSRR